MKTHRSKRFHRHAPGGLKTKTTLAGLVTPTRSHACDFRRIGPNAMARLVAEGLFVKLFDDELGRPQYEITALGRARLRALESKE